VTIGDPEPLDATGAPSMRARRRRWITAIVVVLVVAALGVVLARGWGRVSKYDWRLEPGWLVLGTALVLLAYTFNGLAYGRSVEWLSPVHPSPALALSIWARSLLARYVPGNVMMVVGRAVLSHDEGVPRRVTLAATVYEQALALGIATVGAVAFLAAYGNPGEGRLLWLLVVVPVVLAGLHPVPFRRLSGWALTKAGRPPLETLFTGRQVGQLLLLYAAGTVPLVVGVWALVRSAAGPQAGSLPEVGLAFLLAFVISFLTFVLPSGIGVRDGILALALSRHLPGGVAIAVAVGLRFAMVIIELVFVGLAVLAGRRR
jgi:hypothetical protein